MAQKGWDAAGLLQPLWNRYEGGRDALAKAVGSSGTTLSGVNSGARPLGLSLARRLAAELKVTIFELGAPAEAARTAEERRVVDRLQKLEEADLRLLHLAEALTARVETLERRARPRKAK